MIKKKKKKKRSRRDFAGCENLCGWLSGGAKRKGSSVAIVWVWLAGLLKGGRLGEAWCGGVFLSWLVQIPIVGLHQAPQLNQLPNYRGPSTENYDIQI